ncbi:(2Fe-2S) ferredoxin domain-containing protein [Roseinatronobacter alkalisoli]|uniref:(2Fe-2S) ferredoxin domain-containing protein n=1 Tax=Roseinatronobacter alkalisoli TaxID=3028235 RepID=A0ABT5TC67_9RHOB|nr:(2Fe-2S) ferredoxin domain-containing protein [Roseinatronobacter sp. HJB301]MDD7972716.1 (2Fe-2S) ferredoxin domain-containing protein [Roseinatronobacter sp. HJB301]
MKPVLILLAKAAIAAPAHVDMKAMAHAVAAALPDWQVTWAYSEQGTPTLRAQLDTYDAAPQIRVLPLSLPAEPATVNAIARTVQRWAKGRSGPAPVINVTPPLSSALRDLTTAIVASVNMPPLREVPVAPLPADSAQVPDHHARVLVCTGGPCMNAGAAELWHQLRARQDAEKLRRRAPGMMSCRTSCLGPCALGPVVQVWPEGTYYGGVTLTALDQIIDDHVVGGQPVAALAYAPGGPKQSLRRN